MKKKPNTMTYAQMAKEVGMNPTSLEKALAKKGISKTVVPSTEDALAFWASRRTPHGAWTKEKAQRADALCRRLESGEPGESAGPNQITESKPKKKVESKRAKAPESKVIPMPESKTVASPESKTETAPESKTVYLVLTAVILLDLAMVMVGAWLLLSWVGLLCGAMIALSMWATKELASDASTLNTSGLGIAVAFVLCVFGSCLHYNTLANEIHLDTVKVGPAHLVNWCIAGTISGLSFMALVLTKNLTSEKLFA